MYHKLMQSVTADFSLSLASFKLSSSVKRKKKRGGGEGA